MFDVKVSLIASAVRIPLWSKFLESLHGTSVEYEVIFAGDASLDAVDRFIYDSCSRVFKYQITKHIKPAQCYEIARRMAVGECIVWVADDCEFPNNVIGKAYDYWKSKEDSKLILSIQTKESGYKLPVGQLFDMSIHRFLAGVPSTPLMAPLGMMNRIFLEYLGGLDRRYVCGQYENDIVMRAHEHGGKVEVFGNKDTYIDIDHLGKSLLIGESKTESDFLNRPFAKGYKQDRLILERSWATHKMFPVFNVSSTQLDKFEPYEDKDILEKSQSNKGIWD